MNKSADSRLSGQNITCIRQKDLDIEIQTFSVSRAQFFGEWRIDEEITNGPLTPASYTVSLVTQGTVLFRQNRLPIIEIPANYTTLHDIGQSETSVYAKDNQTTAFYTVNLWFDQGYRPPFDRLPFMLPASLTLERLMYLGSLYYRQHAEILPDQADTLAEARLRHVGSLAYLEFLQLALQAGQPEKPASAKHPAVIKALRYLQDHYAQPVQLQQIADYSNISRAQLTRLFRKQYATSPMNMLRQIRLNRAAALLQFTALPINLIADQCGFNDFGYFSTLFKAGKGLSPSAYRRQFARR